MSKHGFVCFPPSYRVEPEGKIGYARCQHCKEEVPIDAAFNDYFRMFEYIINQTGVTHEIFYDM